MKIDICVLLDRSGSMAAIKSDMEGGLDGFVEEQKKLEGECRFSFARFDTEFEWVHERIPIADVRHLALEPRGMTALNDAFGKTLIDLDKALAEDISAKPDKVIVCVITDGEENSSREFRKEQVKNLVSEHASWEFVFLGANVDAFAEGASYGVGHDTTMAYAATGDSVAASFQAFTVNTSSLRGGSKADMSWTDEQREAQEEANRKKKH